MLQNLCFSLKVYLGVDVGCIDGNMAQPCTDGVDIDSGAKKVSGSRMPDGVGADRPVRQCWQRACDDADVLADHPMNTVPGDGLAQPVEKNRIVRGAVADQSQKLVAGRRPQWTSA